MEKMAAACPDIEFRIDANEDGSDKAWVPVSRNQTAKLQLYKYLGLSESE
jgi:hypothetical protein